MADYKLICADARALPLENESVDCIVTSPPYWGLRDYGEGVAAWWDGDKDCEHIKGERLKAHHPGQVEQTIWKNAEGAGKGQTAGAGRFCLRCGAWYGQFGLEPTIELYIKHIGQCLEEMYRVLKKTGTLWLNIGDTYASGKGTCLNPGGGEKSLERKRKEAGIFPLDRGNLSDLKKMGMRAKSLCLIPERVKLLMVEQGWIIRNSVIWHKPNPMPSSDKDSFTSSYEDVIFAVKNNKALWWWNEKTGEMVYKRLRRDEEGVDWRWVKHTPCKGTGWIVKDGKKQQCPRCKGTGKVKRSYWHGEDYWFDLDAVREPTTWSGLQWGNVGKKFKEAGLVSDHKFEDNPAGKNPGDVWTICTQPYPDAHYATFPEKLVKKCLLAGCPKEICKKCGLARVRIRKPTEEYAKNLGRDWQVKKEDKLVHHKVGKSLVASYQTIGWTDCGCGEGFRPGIALDVFAGSGTVGKVAIELGLDVILIDKKQEYIDQHAKKRMGGAQMPLIG